MKKIIRLGICLGMLGVCLGGNTVSAMAEAQSEEVYQYGVGSVSKTFVSVAVMQLVDQGKVSLDEPVVTYIPEFKMADERYQDITVRMLLNHTSGLMGSLYQNGILFEEGNSETHDKLLEELSTQKLKANPGSYMVYSNDGFVLAELLVEKVTGVSFADYLETNICEPLEMKHTSTAFGNTVKSVSVNQAENFLDSSIQVPYEGVTEVGSGGVRSTTEDLARLSTIFIQDGSDLLSKEAVRETNRDYYPETDYLKLPELNYKTVGLGWDYIREYEFDKYGIKAVGKGGDLDFQHANLTVLPEKNMSAAVLSSSGSSTFNQLVAQAVLLSALEVKGEIPQGSASVNQLQEWQKTLPKESCRIPDEMYDYAGCYVGNHAVDIRFPDDTTMLLKTLDKESQITMKFDYREDGWFYGDDTSAIGQEITNNGDGHTGITKVKLYEESDGKRYLYFSTNAQYTGLGMYAYGEVFGTQAVTQILEESVKSAWDARMGKKYYVYNDRYSSADWARGASLAVKIKDIGQAGYVYGTGCMGVKRIVDENHGESACIGRDMSTITVFQENGTELLSFDDGGSIFICEDGMQELTKDMENYELQENEEAKWFTIPESMEKERMTIQVNGEGMAAVYDQYDQCIFTTLALNGNQSVILPEGGKIVFTGESSAGKNPSVHFVHLK